jgi:hypothetical protein
VRQKNGFDRESVPGVVVPITKYIQDGEASETNEVRVEGGGASPQAKTNGDREERRPECLKPNSNLRKEHSLHLLLSP